MDNPSVGYNAASVLQNVYVPQNLIPSAAAYAANVTYDYASGQAIAYGTPDGYSNSYVPQAYVGADSGVYVDGQGYFGRGYSASMSNGSYMQYSRSNSISVPTSPTSSDPSKPKKQKVKGQGGSSCHQCKSRRNFTALTYCTSNLDKKNKKCRKKFCGHCLKKFYKETPQAIADKTSWRCPSCRKLCCCAACRRRKTKETGGSGSNSPISKAMQGIPGVMVPISGHLGPSVASYKLLRKQQKRDQQSDTDSDSDSDNSPLPYAPDSPYPPPSQRDVAVPPVPTVMMSTSEMSSPMNTPLQAPSHLGFQGDELILKGDSDGADEFDTSRHRFVSTQYHSEEEGPLPYSPPSLNSPPSPSVHYLTATVRKHARAAREAVDSGFTTPFARMYNQWHHNQDLNKKVQMTIGRSDLTSSQQVKTIAQMLRSADQYPQAFMETKDFGLDFPPPEQFQFGRSGFPVPLPYQPPFLVPFPRPDQPTEEFVPPYAWAPPDQYPQFFPRPDVTEPLTEA